MDYSIFGLFLYIVTIDFSSSQDSRFPMERIYGPLPYVHQPHTHHTHNLMNRDLSSKEDISTDNVHYRDRDNTAKYVPHQPASSSKQTQCVAGLCSGVEDYPAEKIHDLLESEPAYRTYFNATELELGLRFALEKDEQTLCKTTTRTIFPEKAKNTDDKEKFIVNVGNYKQGIEFDECAANTKCAFSETLPTTFEVYCKQKFIRKRLLILSEEVEKFVFDTFEVPSCCVCVYKTH